MWTAIDGESRPSETRCCLHYSTQQAVATAEPWSRGRGHLEGPTQHQGTGDTTGEEPSAVTPRQDAERGRGRELVVTTTNELVAPG